MIRGRPGERNLRRVLSLGMLACLFASLAEAGSVCSISHAYPQVRAIGTEGGQVVVQLGKYFSPDSQSPVFLRRTDSGKWTRAAAAVDIESSPGAGCDEEMDPPIDEAWLLERTDYSRTRDMYGQEIGACTSDGRAIWAGTSFYGGEGAWGVGALIRKTIRTGKYRYFHNLNLQPYSTSHLTVFANQLWIGTTYHGECASDNGYGVMRFELRRPEYVRLVPEICGFAVRGMLLHDDRLWIATDLGLSVGSTGADGQVSWGNFVPDLNDDNLMRPVACAALYEQLLRSRRLATDFEFDMGYGFEDFWYRLNKLRPEFVRDYLRKLHGHPEWQWLAD